MGINNIKMSDIFLKNTSKIEGGESVTSATISLPQWITIVDDVQNKEQQGGNYSATSSFNQFDNVDVLSDTSSIAPTKNQQKGGSTEIQDINKLVSMLTSESEATMSENDLNIRIEDFDTVTSVTATSVLEDKLRDLFDNQMELEMQGGAKKKRSKKSKKVDVEAEEAPKKKRSSKRKGSKKSSKKGSKKAAKKSSKKGSKKAARKSSEKSSKKAAKKSSKKAAKKS